MPIQKSPNWDRFAENCCWPVRDGFPFNEGWPKCGPAQDIWFEIILCSGEHHTVRVDFSTQHRAEGKNWITRRGGTFGKQLVVAWRELP